MDKYQKVLLETEKTSIFFTCTSKKNSLVLNGGFNYDEDVYTLTQEEDIFSTKYELVVRTNPNIEACTFLVNGEWQSASRKGSAFSVELDFENRVEKVKLTFADNIVDDYIFSIQYVEADKDLYYQKQEAERKANMLQSAQIKHSTGTDLINTYFQPCCSDYEYTEILLYIPQDYVTVGGPYGPVKKPSSWQMFKKCKVPAEDFYKSINGLAYGTYEFTLKQLDSSGNIVLETDRISFTLSRPNYSGRHTIVI